MKKLISIILLCAMLSGCSAGNREGRISFYYRRKEFQFGSQMGAVSSEKREISGSKDNLSYLVSLYLLGPADENLMLPFPDGTRVKKVSADENGLTVELALGGSMNDSSFTVGCSCLSLTLFHLTDADSIAIETEKRSMTIQRDTVLLQDSVPAEG